MDIKKGALFKKHYDIVLYDESEQKGWFSNFSDQA